MQTDTAPVPMGDGAGRPAGDLDPGALPGPARGRARQGRADLGVRPRDREGTVLLLGGHGDRPAAHAGGRWGRGLPRPDRAPRHGHDALAAVGARRRLVPGRPRAGRGRPAPIADPRGAVRRDGRRAGRARARADRRPRARVLPRRARRRRSHPPPRRPAEHGLHGRPAGRSRRPRARHDREPGPARARRVRHEPRVHERPVRDQPAARGRARRRRPRVPAEVGGQGHRRAERADRDLHGQAVQRPGRLGPAPAPLARTATAATRSTPGGDATWPASCTRSPPACSRTRRR